MKGGTRELRYSTFVSDWWRRRGKSRRRRITGLDSFSLPIEHEKRRKRQRKPFGDFFLHRDGTSEGVIMPSHQVSLPTREKREPEKVERPNLSSTQSCSTAVPSHKRRSLGSQTCLLCFVLPGFLKIRFSKSFNLIKNLINVYNFIFFILLYTFQ